MLRSVRGRLLLVLLFVLILGTAVWIKMRSNESASGVNGKSSSVDSAPIVSVPQHNPSPAQEFAPASPLPTETPFESTAKNAGTTTSDPLHPPPSFVGQLNLIVPVAGVKPNQLQDTFTDARAEGRAHDAIDIPAPLGTPVLAAADGEIIKLFQSERGGTTIYQLSQDRKLIFYYAHLLSYAPGLTEGKIVRQGEVIAFVGDSGNAVPGNYHLHFSIAVVADPKRYWEGSNINPYPLLRHP